MAVLTVTNVEEFQLGAKLTIQKFSGTVANANAADEWIGTNLKSILAVLGSVVTGSAPVASDDITAAVRATGTVTISTAAEGAEFTVNNNRIYTFNATPSGFSSVDIGVTNANSAQNLQNAINGCCTSGSSSHSADTPTNTDVFALAAGGVVTIYAKVPGVGVNTGRPSGNFISLASNDASLVVSGALLTGGLDVVVDAVGLNFVLNAQGTGVAADANAGDLGIESSGSATTFDVTVLGVRR